MSDHLSGLHLQNEVKQWKAVAAYMASCTAATPECMPKSWSKSERTRHTEMCLKFSQYLQGAPLPMGRVGGVEEDVARAISRCENAVQKYGLRRVIEQ